MVAIIPLVIDALNMEESFVNHWRSYGSWAPAVRDYEQTGIFTWLRTPQVAALRAIGPYQYRDRLTVPKYIINSAGDEFFTPDSSRFYFDDLRGEKFLRYVPNTSHALESEDVLTSGLAFFQSVISGSGQRGFSWELLPDGGMRLRTVDRPSEVRLWQATNPKARDFRVQTIGKSWTSTAVTESSPGVFEAGVAAPREGWSAYFLELTYSTGGLIPLAAKFTTPVRIVPETLPFDPPLIALSAANYLPLTAADSFVSGFAQDLTVSPESATSVPLPTNLGGVTVRVRDSGGVERLAPLFYVSPNQINYLVPSGTANGIATIDVLRQDQVVVRCIIESAAAGLFSADGSGRGIAAGIALTARADGSQDATVLNSRTAVSLGGAGDQVYLALFGTGMRGAAAASATVGGEPVPVAGPVPQSEYPGLDQVNLGPLPRPLAGRGEVTIVLTVGDTPTNRVTARIQ